MADQQRQKERKTIKEVKGEGEERGGAHRAIKQERKRSRSGSSSSRSSSDGQGPGDSRAGAKGKSRSKSNTIPYPDSPYKERQQRKGDRSKSAGQGNKKPSKKKEKENDNNNNTKGDNQISVESHKTNAQHPGTPRDSHNKSEHHNNSNNNTNSNQCASSPNGRPVTSGARLESGSTPWGYDNSERNPHRLNLGSSTDQVADQRPIFGPWRAPDPEKQRLLVERLAPAKPPAPPDPRFNHWKNHFLYYWHIGAEQKPRREGNYQNSPRRHQHSEVGRTSAHSRNGYDHRLLKRPKTTSGIVMRDSNNNNSNNMNLDLSNHPYTGSASINGRPSKPHRGTQSAREYGPGDSPRVVSGLDRRYMGLQAVSSSQMQDIVDRLTRMTSAYHAKFAPNPHVWVDTEPGAHMVKRSNTTFS